MEPDNFELDNFGYLLGETARVLTKRFDQFTRENGVTHTQWMVLIALMRREGISQTRLARYLEVEPITLSRMIDRLEGLIKRAEDPNDRRTKLLYLTDAARDALQRLRSYGAVVLTEASQGISPQEIQQFIATTNRIRANLLNALGPIETGKKIAP